LLSLSAWPALAATARRRKRYQGAAGNTLAASPEQSNHERCDEQDQENEEQHLGDLGCAGGDPAEAKNRCDNRYDKKYQRVVEHL